MPVKLIAMILAYHGIFSAYGFWLPNDPRGSWSTEVWAPHLQRFGDATKTTDRRSLAHDVHNAQMRLAAKSELLFPPVHFNTEQIAAIGRGFARIVPILDLRIHACAVLPDHVHVVVARHAEPIESIVGFLKRAATRQLNAEGLHPLRMYAKEGQSPPTPWVRGGWNRYLNTRTEILGAIDYVRSNPLRIGMPVQTWNFENPFV